MPLAPLLARLAALAEAGGEHMPLCIRARHEHGVRSIVIERPTFAVLVEGRKHLRLGASETTITPGTLFLLPHGGRIDAINTPDTGSGRYRTVMAPVCAEVIEAARLLWPRPPARPPELPLVTLDADLLRPELHAWCDALEHRRDGAARGAMAALLIRLCELGHDWLLAPPPPSVTARIRAMVAAEPARDWRSTDFEAELGMSGATLRRRLAAESSSLADTLAEARLGAAIGLLYTTDWPVKTIAARVGYRSVPSFVRRFVERYGMEPHEVGNA
ncbi:helix-turn-helix transcriptional regulator [Derxia gummosa]|uniref:Helix-turn-helix transcriptional regulator n=1 Tax=Derxia gummosa DSM 723 TaxID=1121388 RepID=A0A8B6X3E5_9BURK|nr:AraC family transcriptional regulator [Derxia gummosa]